MGVQNGLKNQMVLHLNDTILLMVGQEIAQESTPKHD